MTDEEIEKTLRRNADNIGGGFDSRVLDYINRLKAENAMLRISDDSKEKCILEQHGEIHRLRDELKQVRKDTAKEVLDDLKEACPQGYLGIGLWAQQEYIKYGVEVDDE